MQFKRMSAVSVFTSAMCVYACIASGLSSSLELPKGCTRFDPTLQAMSIDACKTQPAHQNLRAISVRHVSTSLKGNDCTHGMFESHSDIMIAMKTVHKKHIKIIEC